jgi:hypothetical protein
VEQQLNGQQPEVCGEDQRPVVVPPTESHALIVYSHNVDRGRLRVGAAREVGVVAVEEAGLQAEVAALLRGT